MNDLDKDSYPGLPEMADAEVIFSIFISFIRSPYHIVIKRMK